MGENPSMRILITGVNGVVGSQLNRQLKQRGNIIVGCDLSHNEYEKGFSLNDPSHSSSYIYSRCDVSEYRQLDRLLETYGPFDLVYHTAAEFGRWNGEDFYENLWKTNVIGTKHLLALQAKQKFKLVHFSSSEVYGDYQDLMTEDTLDKFAIAQMNDYAMTKRVNEMQIANHNKLYNCETVIVRLFNTYGPGENYSPYRSVNVRFLYLALNNLPITVFKGHRRTSTYLEDTVQTIANISDNFIPGRVYNIAGSVEHSIEELAELACQVTGAPTNLIQYKESEILTTRYKTVDSTLARTELQHNDSVSLKEGLLHTANYLLKRSKIE